MGESNNCSCKANYQLFWYTWIVFLASLSSFTRGIHADTFSGESDYSTSASVNGSTIRLDDTPYKSYTHYVSESRTFGGYYTFVVETAPDFDGVFIHVGVIVLDTSLAGGPVKICTNYWIQFVYSNGMTKNLCNGTELANPPELVGQDFVTVIIQIRPSYFFTDPLNTYNFGYDSRPLVGTTGRSIPITSVGAISFTSYKDCSGKESEEIARNLKGNDTSEGNEEKMKSPARAITSDLRSCSTFSKSKCIHSKLFCNGDINCELPILDYLLTGKIHKSGYDERGDSCPESYIWKQKTETTYGSYSYPSYSDDPTAFTESSSFGTEVIIIIGVIFALLGVFALAFVAKHSKARSRNDPEAFEQLYPKS